MAAKAKTAKKDKYIVLWSECGDDSQWTVLDPLKVHASAAEAKKEAELEAGDGVGGSYAIVKFVAIGRVNKLDWD